jgi:hypothetical protein
MRWLLLALLVCVLSGLALADCTQAQLNTEFTTDPTTRTYASCASGNDQCVLEKFNAPCPHASCKQDQTVSRETLYEAIESDELKTLANSTAPGDTARMTLLSFVLANATFNLGKGEVRQKIFDVFTSAGSPLTNAAITALQQKDASRAQMVCGRQGTLQDVSCGLRGESCS